MSAIPTRCPSVINCLVRTSKIKPRFLLPRRTIKGKQCHHTMPESYAMMRFIISLAVWMSLAVTVICVDEYSRSDFPPGFVFGSGTSAYQVEGAANEDGRTPSIFDTFAHTGYLHGANGDVACEQYHKYKEDVQLMANTGLEAYRFSISWSRLIPNGRGPVNPRGLQYYNNLINELVSHGIQAHVTLHHFDLPQALEDEYGGWVNRRILKDFTDYADVCFREFGDRVQYWTTINEVNIFAVAGYDEGIAPPGRCSPPFGKRNCSAGNSSTEPYLAVHNMLLAHASVARLYEKKYKAKQHGFVGTSLYSFGASPLTNSQEDAIATQRFKDFLIGWILHPLVFGEYPAIMKKNVGSRMPVFTKQQSKQLKGAFDFLGVIYYTSVYVNDNSSNLNLRQRDFYIDQALSTSLGDSSFFTGLSMKPSGLQGVLEYVKQVYGNPPLYILENGQVTRGSSLIDSSRVKYLHFHIGTLLDAVRNGSNTRGYFQWSLLDLFELLSGYDSTFGLFHVDFKDRELTRHPKLSAHWYSHFLKGGRVSSDGLIELEKNLSVLSHAHLSQ